MKRVSVIDVGSNSLRVVVAQIMDNGSFVIIKDLKEAVRLGEGMEESGKLQAKKISRAIATLKMFKNLCRVMQVEEIIAVATAAVRRAGNQEEFLRQVEAETGLRLRVLSGQEEAYYAYWGTINSINFRDGLIMDLGGGSAEIISVKDREIADSISLNFGTITLSQHFDFSQPLNDQREKALLDFLNDAFRQVPWLKTGQHDLLVGIGGSVRNMAKILQTRRQYPLNMTHDYRLKSAELRAVFHLLKERTLAERKAIPGLAKGRADIMPGAAAAFAALADYCRIKKVVVSGKGIREGLLFAYGMAGQSRIGNVLDFSIDNILLRYDLDRRHAQKVYSLTRAMYLQLAGPSILNEDLENVIRAGTMLHDAGLAVGYYSNRKFVFDVILHSEVNGLSHRELVMSAFIASFDQCGISEMERQPYRGLLKNSDWETIARLGVLLRIAGKLDRSMYGIVQSVNCSQDDRLANIEITADLYPRFEMKSAETYSDLFKSIFGKQLKFSYVQAARGTRGDD